MAMGPFGNPFPNSFPPFPGLFDDPLRMRPFGPPPPWLFPARPPVWRYPAYPMPHTLQHAKPISAMSSSFPKKQDAEAESETESETENQNRYGMLWFTKQVLETGLTVGASVVGGLFGGPPGAMAAGAATSGALNLLDQLLGNRKAGKAGIEGAEGEGKTGIDWGSVLLDATLGILPGGVGEFAFKTGEKALAKLTGKAVAQKVERDTMKHVMLTGAVDGAAMGYVGGFLQSGYQNYKDEGRVDFSKANNTGMQAILPGLAGGALGGGLFTALRREISRGQHTQKYEAKHEVAITKLRNDVQEKIPNAQLPELTWRQRLSSALFERSENKVIRNFHRVDDHLLRGAMPESYGAFYKLKRKGVKTIIDLRGEGDAALQAAQQFERTCANALGIKYVPIAMYADAAPDKGHLRAFFKEISAAELNGKKVYLHCKQGIDRTGVLTAAYEVARNGKSQKQAFQDMQRHGYNWIHDWKYPAQRTEVLSEGFPKKAKTELLHARAEVLHKQDILSDGELEPIKKHLMANRLQEAEQLIQSKWPAREPETESGTGTGTGHRINIVSEPE